MTNRKDPPLHTRFQKGVCPNPKGRGAAKPLRAGKIFDDVINGTIVIQEGSKKRHIPKNEYIIRRWIQQALKGDLKFAERLIQAYTHSKKHGDYRHEPVIVEKEWQIPGRRRRRGLMIEPVESAIEAAALYRLLIQEGSDEE